MKNILITGGMGFIGFHSIKKWQSENWKVTVVDNLSSNAIEKHNEILDNVDLIVGDLNTLDQSQLAKFDLILHLASPVGPVGVLKHAGYMAKMILDDLYWCINTARANDCPLIFVSTSEIFGYRNVKTNLSEDDDKVFHNEYTVRNEYSSAKLLAEIVLTNIGKINKKLKYQIIRPFNVTGAYQLPDGGFVLPRFVIQAINNKPLSVYGDGKQKRAFTWVGDIVNGIYLTSVANKENWNQKWNIGNEDNEKSIEYLANKVVELSGSKSEVIKIDPKELHGKLFDEAPEKIPNSSKIRNALGWKPTKNADEVIFEVLDFYNALK